MLGQDDLGGRVELRFPQSPHSTQKPERGGVAGKAELDLPARSPAPEWPNAAILPLLVGVAGKQRLVPDALPRAGFNTIWLRSTGYFGVSVRTYQVTVGEQTVWVAVRREGVDTFVRVGSGPEQPAQLSVVERPLYGLLVGDGHRELLLRRTSEDVQVAMDGFTYGAQVVDEARAKLAMLAGAGQISHARRELKAPMPGLVVRVSCQPGDIVEQGQPLVVLQAMKMENELSVPHEGTIKSVHVQPGQTVDQGQVLVVLE